MTNTQRFEQWIDSIERQTEIATDEQPLDDDDNVEQCSHQPDPVTEAHASTGVVAQCRYCNADMDALAVKLAGYENICDECLDEDALATGVYPL